MEIGTKKVRIGDLEFTIRYSNIALLKYLNSKEPENPKVLYRYFFDLSQMGAKAEGIEFNYTFDEFSFAIDPYPETIKNFQEAISSFSSGGDGKKQKVPK